MAKQQVTDPQLLKKLGDQAATRFRTVQDRVALIKERIKANRRGLLELSDISDDADRMGMRMAREEAMGIPDPKERVNGVPNFQDVSVVHRISQSSKAVCRILTGGGRGQSSYGTGFMVAPGILITNNHVLPTAESAARTVAQFNYELDLQGRALAPVSFKLLPNRFFLTSPADRAPDDPTSGLDFTLVAVDAKGDQDVELSRFGHVSLDGTLGKIIDGENCVVVQHPKGDYKKIVLRDIRMITLTEDVLIYESDTHPGSSGSMVLGLGTGEVVALHHSAVPRTNDKGEWIRKDGSVWQLGDGDEMVDWIGNEGIRISRIIDALRRADLPDGMDALRRTILDRTPPPNVVIPASIPPVTMPNIANPEPRRADQTAEKTEVPRQAAKTGTGFELILTKDDRLREVWERRAAELVPGLTSCRPMFPGSTDPEASRAYFIRVNGQEDPWVLSDRIEALPHVESCTPDLSMYTDQAGAGGGPGGVRATEGAVGDFIYDDGTTDPNEKEFKERWGRVDLIKKLIEKKPQEKNFHRQWNWNVVNWSGRSCLGDAAVERLASLRFVQLDTGYSRHSKVVAGYDLAQDRDFIDEDDDAQDDKSGFFFKQPGHGTRTASIAIGGRMPTNGLDGNLGLLSDDGGRALARLIPYRISRSVILLGRTEELVNAVEKAISTGTDVMFMCMGTYSRAAIALAAKQAYEHGVIWVCAAGNQVKLVIAPAMYPGTIAVAAVNPKREPWSGSCRGPEVDVAAPGEDVYVPNWGDKRKEIMSFGSGTSYATPHVASAAMLWKATHLPELRKKYPLPWQVVEAFRQCLKASVSRHPSPADAAKYGAGILDLDALLKAPLPEANDLKHAYGSVDVLPHKDLGDRELLHTFWNETRSSGPVAATESIGTTGLSPRARMALEARMDRPPSGKYESMSVTNIDRARILKDLFVP